MNTPSHVLEANLSSLSARMSKLEKRFDAMSPPPADAPATLTVDKKGFSDYWRDVSASAEADDDSDDLEEHVNPMGNLTPQHLHEVVAAFDELLRWKDFPNPTMNQEMREYIDQHNFRRLQEAIAPLEKALRAAE